MTEQPGGSMPEPESEQGQERTPGAEAPDSLVDVLAARMTHSRTLVGPDEDCGLDADCPPDQICLDGHCL